MQSVPVGKETKDKGTPVSFKEHMTQLEEREEDHALWYWRSLPRWEGSGFIRAKDEAELRRSRPPKADKAASDMAKPQPRNKMTQSKPPVKNGAAIKAEAPAATE